MANTKRPRTPAGCHARAIRWAFVAICGTVLAAPARAAESLPNIIVIFVDDMGYADVGAQGQQPDVRTPHLDQLAREGVRCTAGYITAPQCSPSRAGLITGRYQQRFGLDTIPDCPLPLEERTIADRLKPAGYLTGMVGKWHLEPNQQSVAWARQSLGDVPVGPRGRVEIPLDRVLDYYPHRRGFEEYFVGTKGRYFANYDLEGNRHSRGDWVVDNRFRVDVQSDAAVSFVRRNSGQPFFLYLCYYAPHVPLEATPESLSRFSADLPERRRYALSMISAIDEGVGRILKLLAEQNLDEKTLIVFTSDNGAPLNLTAADLPVGDSSSWNGSLNTPWVGEKGMLSEGGLRVPFLLRWKGRLPAGTVYSEPVSSLDIAATALAAAGQPHDAQLDGVDLTPYLAGQRQGAPHEALYWRFWNQAAVRVGKWKLIQLGQRTEYLFDLLTDEHETRNLAAEHPNVAMQLRARLHDWTATLQPPGPPNSRLFVSEQNWYEHFFDLPPSSDLRPRNDSRRKRRE